MGISFTNNEILSELYGVINRSIVKLSDTSVYCVVSDLIWNEVFGGVLYDTKFNIEEKLNE